MRAATVVVTGRARLMSGAKDTSVAPGRSSSADPPGRLRGKLCGSRHPSDPGRLSMPRATTRSTLVLVLIAASLAPGCSRDSAPTAPQQAELAARARESALARSSEAGWYPLEVGNSWTLRGHTIVRLNTP